MKTLDKDREMGKYGKQWEEMVDLEQYENVPWGIRPFTRR